MENYEIAIAEFLAARPMAATSAATGTVNRCTASTPMSDPSATGGWNGWGNNPSPLQCPVIQFDIGGATYFMYQGIFDTDFDKYTEDAVALFTKYGLNTVFENLEMAYPSARTWWGALWCKRTRAVIERVFWGEPADE